MPRIAWSVAGQLARAPLSQGIAELLAPFAAAMPAGLFDSAPFERCLRRLYGSGGRTNDFRELRRRLFIVATNLNTGEAALFGQSGLEHVPISRAIQASTALPGLYSPVEIDGETYADGAPLRTMHASVVLEAGADLLFCVNPLVPFDASDGGSRKRVVDLTDCGLPVVLSQTPRSLIRRPRWNGSGTTIAVSCRTCHPRSITWKCCWQVNGRSGAGSVERVPQDDRMIAVRAG